MIMESLSKLEDADAKFQQVIFTHDMIKEERNECKPKLLVEKAKKRQAEDKTGGILIQGERDPGKSLD